MLLLCTSPPSALIFWRMKRTMGPGGGWQVRRIPSVKLQLDECVRLTVLKQPISMFLTSAAVFLLKSIIPLFYILGHTLIAQAAKEKVECIPPSGEAVITWDIFFLIRIGFLGWLGSIRHLRERSVVVFFFFFSNVQYQQRPPRGAESGRSCMYATLIV